MGMPALSGNLSVTFGGIEVPLDLGAFQLLGSSVNQIDGSTHASLSAAIPNHIENIALSGYSPAVPPITSGCRISYHTGVGPASIDVASTSVPETGVVLNTQKYDAEIDPKYVLPSLLKIKNAIDCKRATKKSTENIPALAAYIAKDITGPLSREEDALRKEYESLSIVQAKIKEAVSYAEKGDNWSLQRYMNYLLDIAENVDSMHFYASRSVKPEYVEETVRQYRESYKIPEGTDICVIFSDVLDDIGREITQFASNSVIKKYLDDLENFGEKSIHIGGESCVIIDSGCEKYPQIPHGVMLSEELIEKISAAETMSMASGLEKICKYSGIVSMEIVLASTLFSAEQAKLAELLEEVKEPLVQELLVVAKELCSTAIEKGTGIYSVLHDFI